MTGVKTMNTICIILICVSVALVAFEVGRRCGKAEFRTVQSVGNVNNSSVNQSRDIKRKNIVLTTFEVLPHVTSPKTREKQSFAAREKIAKDLGRMCWVNGCIAFDYKENDLEYPSGVFNDRVWGSISAEKLEE